MGVPNDPTNEYRALKLLEEAGVLKLKDGVEVKATKNDIAENPKDIEIVELEASQIPSQLNELAAAAINTNFAFGAGLTINEDAIYHEPLEDNPNYNVFAVRTENKDDKIVKESKSIINRMKQRNLLKKIQRFCCSSVLIIGRIHMIELKQVSKVYQQKKAPLEAVKDVDLTIEKRGKSFGVVGYSGAGKSTLNPHDQTF